MSTEITFYGQLADIAGTDKLILGNIDSVSALVEKLHADFPELRHKKYLIAVNNQIIKGNSTLTGHSKISLLPPFSGG